jgi:hypothetical protein
VHLNQTLFGLIEIRYRWNLIEIELDRQVEIKNGKTRRPAEIAVIGEASRDPDAQPDQLFFAAAKESPDD